jgi:hypothetical protein
VSSDAYNRLDELLRVAGKTIDGDEDPWWPEFYGTDSVGSLRFAADCWVVSRRYSLRETTTAEHRLLWIQVRRAAEELAEVAVSNLRLVGEAA